MNDLISYFVNPYTVTCVISFAIGIWLIEPICKVFNK